MKKLLSICMALIMSISSISIVFAKESQAEAKRLGATEILNVKTLDSGSKIYTAMYGDVQNLVTESKVANGTLYTFEQDDLKNELLITKDGKMYLDGDIVKVTMSCDNAVENKNDDAVARAYYEYWDISKTKFAPGSYVYNRQEYSYRLQLAKKFSQLTVGAIAGVVIGALFANPTAGAVAAFKTYDGFAEFYDWMNAINPDQDTAYVRKIIWSNGNPNTNINPIESYFEVNTTYSDDEDFSSSEYSDNFYAIQYINNH